jgi:hypothetical protein
MEKDKATTEWLRICAQNEAFADKAVRRQTSRHEWATTWREFRHQFMNWGTVLGGLGGFVAGSWAMAIAARLI